MIALKAKCYAYLKEDSRESKRLKGIKRNVLRDEITFK